MRSRMRFTRWVTASLATLAVTMPAVASRASAASPVRYHNTPIASWRTDGTGYASLVVGEVAYIGGEFSTLRSPDGSTVVPRQNLVAVNVRTGEPIDTFTANTNGSVRALATDGTRLFIGGQFTSVNGVSRQRVAALDPLTGAVDTAWSANASSNVYALAVGGGKLFIGGSFSTLKSTTRTRVGAVSLSSGALDSYAPVLDATVLALAVKSDGSRVYLGGDFTTVNAVARPYLAVTSGSGSLRTVNWSSIDASVFALSLNSSGSRLAVGLAGGSNRGALYRTDRGTRLWSQGCGGDAQAIRIIDTSVFTGFHESCDDDLSRRLTLNDLDSGDRDDNFNPTFNKYWGVRGIDGNANGLVIAGDFTNVAGVPAQGFAIFPHVYVPPPPLTLPSDATWRYLVSPSDPEPTWTQPGFDDSGWASGPAQFGYGDGDEATTVGFGPSSSSKYITTWFRSTFEAAAVPLTLTLDLVADDGAVVYLNGVEVARDNMPTGTITSATRARSSRSGSSENTARSFDLPPSPVVAGTNTIAVEVHQSSPSSNDMSFAAALESTADPNATTTTSTTSSTTTTTETPTSTTTTSSSSSTTTTTTTTETPTSTTTTTTTLPGGSQPVFATTFEGPDGSDWGGEWTTSATNGSVTRQGGAGRLAFNDVSSANARATLSGSAPLPDSEMLLSYRFGSTGSIGYFNVYLRGSGGWANSYRPRNGYGLEFRSNSTSVTVRKVSGGTSASLRSVSGANAVTTARQWLRLRVVGSTIQFRTWLDGDAEPATWSSTDTDTDVTADGTPYLSYVRGGSNTGARHVEVDDLTLTEGS